ncbi:glycosyl hydrolase family 28-related protein [Nocardia sp. NPDC057668]|uniref:glycosyl hydrolase family 28-related protein n=1 Tax=Nocardia sp. NPDC057668 TaxID=3346202 RepID=UPI00366F5FC3
MTGEGMQRRRMLAGALGAAVTLPVAACAAAGPGAAAPGGTVRNVRDFGAIGDGTADDTAAIAAACRIGDEPLVLYLPSGTYRVTRWPELSDFATIYGDGGDATTILCETDTTLISLRHRQRVRFARLGIYLTGPSATAVSLFQCFRCSFDSVVIRGNHLSDNFPRYAAQRGVVLEGNTGGTAFLNCDINNFGFGLVTSCIQNYVTSSKFTNNRIGVLGTGNDHNAGLALTNVEFVSDNDPRTTDKHLWVDGASNDWWLTNVWFEGSDIALSIGQAGGAGGPSQFGMVNCKVAARSVCLDLIHCRQPYLANVRFDPDPHSTPIELRIDAAGCPEGTAINLISSAAADIAAGVFPPGWQVIGRGSANVPAVQGTLIAQATGDADVFRAQAPDGAPMSAILSSGAWFSDRADGGVVLKDPEGGYWRLVVSPSGALTTAPLGKQRPTR